MCLEPASPGERAAATTGDHDFEGQLMAVEERWTVLCDCIENRRASLERLRGLWNALDATKCELSDFIGCAEKSLRQMERSPTEEKDVLVQQLGEIAVS